LLYANFQIIQLHNITLLSRKDTLKPKNLLHHEGHEELSNNYVVSDDPPKGESYLLDNFLFFFVSFVVKQRNLG